MKLSEVLQLLVLFGVHEDEVRHLLSQPHGWETIQEKVKKTWTALEPYITSKDLTNIYYKIQELKLKNTQKSEAQEMKEQRELADKLKSVGQENGKYNPEKIKEMFKNTNLGDIFGFMGKEGQR